MEVFRRRKVLGAQVAMESLTTHTTAVLSPTVKLLMRHEGVLRAEVFGTAEAAVGSVLVGEHVLVQLVFTIVFPTALAASKTTL